MGKTRSILVLFLLALNLAANTQSTPLAARADLSQAIDDAVSKKGLPSVVVVLFDERHILWSHVAGYADIASKRVPTLNTRYRLG